MLQILERLIGTDLEDRLTPLCFGFVNYTDLASAPENLAKIDKLGIVRETVGAKESARFVEVVRESIAQLQSEDQKSSSYS